MGKRPAVNPNTDEIADKAKHEFAVATEILAETQYRLAELAGLGVLDRNESMRLQRNIFRVWEHLYFGTLCAVRDESTDDWTWAEDENTYSDGRPVRVKVRIEPQEHSEFSWEHNSFCLEDGAVAEHPLGTICCILPVNPADEIIAPPKTSLMQQEEFEALSRRLRGFGLDRLDDDGPEDSDEEGTQ
jgi:hypothetical protein